ncbi:MAG TPA: phage tail protein [Actinomycetota bacterium]|nr:phage tail protein [Actinomycetota bacterium]
MGIGPPPPSGLTMAYLKLSEMKSSASGEVSAGAETGTIEFQFNPKEFQVEKSAKWQSHNTAGSKNAGPAQYIGANPAAMTLEMFLDASEASGGDVSKDVQKLIDACTPTEASQGKDKPVPPAVSFGWDKVYFVGYIEKVTAKYTLFQSNGKPIRAVCTISLKELPKKEPAQNPTSGALSAFATRQFLEGDSLAGIAYQEYGDPTLWRSIAEVNGIDDPMSIPPGRHLMVPSATEAAGGAL